MSKINQSIESTTIDQDGNITQKSENKVINWGDEPAFIKVYFQDILYLSDIPVSNNKILYALLKRASYAGRDKGMQLFINAALKRQIAQELGYKNISSISNAISELAKGQILLHKDTGLYELNPYLFGKGQWPDISRLRLKVSYSDIGGRTFKTTCEFKDELKNENLELSDDFDDFTYMRDEIYDVEA